MAAKRAALSAAQRGRSMVGVSVDQWVVRRATKMAGHWAVSSADQKVDSMAVRTVASSVAPMAVKMVAKMAA